MATVAREPPCVENVVPARHLKADQAKMEEMYESKFTEINAR